VGDCPGLLYRPEFGILPSMDVMSEDRSDSPHFLPDEVYSAGSAHGREGRSAG